MTKAKRKKKEPYTELEKELAEKFGISVASVRKTYGADIKEGRRQRYEKAINSGML